MFDWVSPMHYSSVALSTISYIRVNEDQRVQICGHTRIYPVFL